VSHFYPHFAGRFLLKIYIYVKYIVFNPQVHGIRCILPPKDDSGGHLVMYDTLHLTEHIRSYDESSLPGTKEKRVQYATNDTHTSIASSFV